jgi:protein-S-isoprenylcysteine O-methyltransferase Ste14
MVVLTSLWPKNIIIGSTHKMILRAILSFLALPTIVAGVFPLVISWIPSPDLFNSFFGLVLIIAGSGMLLSTVVSFYRHGKGTLAPWDPPKHLVVKDCYRFNRNPMYVGVVILVLGWAFLTGSLWNYVYSAIIPVIFHLRVVLYEEKEMQRLFGKEWEIYRMAVPRWGVCVRPYRSCVEPTNSAGAKRPHR